MGFVGAVGTCLRKYATFSGRARRPEYWWFALFALLAAAAAAFVDAALGAASEAGPASLIVGLGLVVPGLAVAWRRLHDVGRSGWFVLAPHAGSVATTFLVLAMSASMEWQTGATPAVLQALAALSGLVTLGLFLALLVWLLSTSQSGENGFGAEPPA